MIVPTPALTAEQRQAAAAKAVAARRTRAEVGRSLKTGRISVAALLARAEADDAVAGMRVSAVLAALPRYGPTRAAAAMAALRISPGRRVRGLGRTQRAGLLGLDRQSGPASNRPPGSVASASTPAPAAESASAGHTEPHPEPHPEPGQ